MIYNFANIHRKAKLFECVRKTSLSGGLRALFTRTFSFLGGVDRCEQNESNSDAYLNVAEQQGGINN
jgi:hypothetical protein